MARSFRRGTRRNLWARSETPRGASSLQEILNALASVLLTRGVTPRAFVEFSNSAFVRAAAVRSKLRNGRVNYSHVAAQTGLSRADVKRLLTRDCAPLPVKSSAVERVVEGWRHDPEFTTQNGIPRALPIDGRRSFRRLARKYAGDIPYRAVLRELERTGLASTTSKERARLSKPHRIVRKHDLRFLTNAVPVLIDGIRAATQGKQGRSASIHRLLLPVSTEFELPFIRDRCVSATATMLDGLRNTLVPPSRQAERAPASWMAITVLLVEEDENSEIQ